MQRSSPRRQLPRDPEPSTPRLVTVAGDILAGRIVLPKFQRGFVWSRQQILNLLDSVARNYPIGSILLWESDQELASERAIADLEVDSLPSGHHVNYLLDGQQRLSTICGALYWEPDGDPKSPWNIVYDLTEDAFQHRDDFAEPPATQLPLRFLLDAAEFVVQLERVADEELKQRAKLLYNRFANYQIATVTLRDMSIEEIGLVFERINTTGTDLTLVEFMRAATWTPDFDLLDSIDEIKAVLHRKRYGDLDPKVMLRAIAATAGFGYSRGDTEQIRKLPKPKLKEAIERTKEAASRTVDFLVTEIRTPSSRTLPYDTQFAILVDVFSRIDRPTSAQYEAIRRWFWRTTLGGRFQNWNLAQMTADHAAVADFASGKSGEIDVPVSVPRSEIWRQSKFRVENAVSKMVALMLADATPLDIRTGVKLDTGKALSWANDKEWHHFFPKDFLKRHQGVDYDGANVPANIVMLSSATNIFISNQPPAGYLRDFVDESGERKILDHLASCLVTEEAFEAATRNDYGEFLRIRSETLHRRALELAGLNSVP
ncbi:GmrSD restriction endonuclease domain-containing protein [Streptosporangium canum]|uniref:GmrSD restriction endonuclease domain-containing protein n=1 Tax=Streptosporangium canum TaxID=324952 RepID=UPI00367AAF90